ncbi:MAG: hypothetical protein U0768_13250 [Anaerolineae bacterium]
MAQVRQARRLGVNERVKVRPRARDLVVVDGEVRVDLLVTCSNSAALTCGCALRLSASITTAPRFAAGRSECRAGGGRAADDDQLKPASAGTGLRQRQRLDEWEVAVDFQAPPNVDGDVAGPPSLASMLLTRCPAFANRRQQLVQIRVGFDRGSVVLAANGVLHELRAM